MYENVTISVELQGSNFLAHARLKNGNCLTDGWAFDCDIAVAQQNAVMQAIQNQNLCNGGIGDTTVSVTKEVAKEPVQTSEQVSEKIEEAEAVSIPEPTGVPAGWPFGSVDASCIPDDVKNIMPVQPTQVDTQPTASAPTASKEDEPVKPKPKKAPKKESAVELTEEQIAARGVSSGGIIEKYGNMSLGEIFDEDKDAICFLASDLAEAPDNIREAAATLVSLIGK